MYEFNLDKCNKSKDILSGHDEAQLIYKNYFSYPKVIGNCTFLCRLLLPESYEDFYKKYLNYAEHNRYRDINWRGLAYDELLKQSQLFKNRVEEKINVEYDIDVYFYCLVCHIIVETFDGKKKEIEFLNHIKNLDGYECTTFDPNIDASFGVDLKVTCPNGVIYALQVKPDTFFCGVKNISLQEDRIGMINKRNKMRKRYGIETIYSVYCRDGINSGKWFMKDNGKLTFKLEQLLEFDGEYDYTSYKTQSLSEEEKKQIRDSVKPKQLPQQFCSFD